jgi:hypothetical protein
MTVSPTGSALPGTSSQTLQADQRRLKTDQTAKASQQVIASDQARIRKDQQAAAKTTASSTASAAGIQAASALSGQGASGKDARIDTYA